MASSSSSLDGCIQAMQVDDTISNTYHEGCDNCDYKTEQTPLLTIPHHLLGFIGSFIDIFDLYELMKTSKSMNLHFKTENNHSTMKSCIRNVFDDDWLQLALSANSMNIIKAIQWLYQDTLIYRQCHEYKVMDNIYPCTQIIDE